LHASRQMVYCPIAVSCNSCSLGTKFLSLSGHIDEMLETTKLFEDPSEEKLDRIHTFTMEPKVYTGFDHLFNIGAYKAHVGSVEHYHDFEEWKMHFKIRRLEAHLIGGTTRMDCVLKAATLGRQKKNLKGRKQCMK